MKRKKSENLKQSFIHKFIYCCFTYFIICCIVFFSDDDNIIALLQSFYYHWHWWICSFYAISFLFLFLFFFHYFFHILLRSHLPFTSYRFIPFLFFLIEKWNRLVNNHLSSPLSSFFLSMNHYCYRFYCENKKSVQLFRKT